MEEVQTPCVIYAAKSTQDKKGSIQTQLADCQTLAEREGWRIANIFKDEGFSAYSGNRGPGLERAKQAAAQAAREAGVPAVLVAQHSDRIARGAGDAPGAADSLVEVWHQLARQNVQMWTVQSGHLKDPLYVAVDSQRNHEDSKRKSEAVRAGKRRQFERGERLGGPVPDGYRLVDALNEHGVAMRHYEIDPDRKPTVRRIFALASEGLGDPSIFRRLNAEGHRRKSGALFQRRTVQALLLNPEYAGLVPWRGEDGSIEETRPGKWPGYITPEEFDRIQAMRAERDKVKTAGAHEKRRGGGGRETTRFALGNGLARCQRCGDTIYARRSNYVRKTGPNADTKARTYACEHYAESDGACDQPRIDAEKVDRAIVAHLSRLFIDFDEWITEKQLALDGARREAEERLAAERRELASREKQEAKLRDLYINDPTNQAREEAYLHVLEKRDQARHQLATAEREVDALPTEPDKDAMLDVWDALSRALQGYLDADLGDLNRKLRELFDRFELDTVAHGVVGVVPVLHRDLAAKLGTDLAVIAQGDETTVYARSELTLPPANPLVIYATGDEKLRNPAEPGIDVADLFARADLGTPPVKPLVVDSVQNAQE